MFRSEMMVIDVIHDTQEVFRTILHCMSRPGTIESIDKVGKQLEHQVFCHYSTLLSAMTLLDAEVSFHVVGENAAQVEEFLSAYTLSNVSDLHVADYIFVMKDISKQDVSDVFTKAKKGTLTNPQQSATIIIETEIISNEPHLTLQGPGIATTEKVQIAASTLWMDERTEANQEYPLGVDIILIDYQGNMMCLPRTTSIHDCGVS